MNAKECRATRREIDESELNQRLSNQARAHVAVCSACRDFGAERASLRELVGSLEPVNAPGDFETRLRARIASEQGRARQPFILRFVTSTPALAAAALIVMLATTLIWLVQRNTSQSPLVARPPASTSVPSTPSSVVAKPDESTVASRGTDGSLGTPTVTGNVAKPGSQDRHGRFALAGKKSRPAGPTSTDYGVAGAQRILKQVEPRAGEVSLSAPRNPMVVSMQDDRGATREISLPPVSFGSQRLVDNRLPVSLTNSRIW
jgi:hypothetical protein